MTLCEPLNPEIARALLEVRAGYDFAPLLLSVARSIDVVDEVFAYRLVDGGKPESLFSSSELADSADRAIAYANHFYAHDPAVLARSQVRVGTSFAQRVSASEVNWARYRDLCFDRPRFEDKLCFGWRGVTETMVISFYRKSGGSSQTMAALGGLAHFAMSAFADNHTPKPYTAPERRLEKRLELSFPALSRREREICARTILGWTADRIACSFGISRSTVLTYRQRAYQRLGFSNAGEFVPFVLSD